MSLPGCSGLALQDFRDSPSTPVRPGANDPTDLFRQGEAPPFGSHAVEVMVGHHPHRPASRRAFRFRMRFFPPPTFGPELALADVSGKLAFMHRWTWTAVLALTSAILLLAGCRDQVIYDVKGVVVEIRATNSEALIRHEKIPGYMEAMTMPFDVKDPGLLVGLKSGDVVQFKLHVEPKDSWATSFHVLSNIGPQHVVAPAPPPPILNDPNGVSFYKEVPELKLGDVLPDYQLTNQFGQSIQLSQFRGKVLVFNFFFSRCPLPDFCPREADNLSRVMRTLKADPMISTNWQILSVSFEPEFDTPKVMESYARRHQYDPQRWTFATGAYEQVQPLGSHFGIYFGRNVTPDNQNHNLRTVILDREGKVVEIIIGNRWTPTQVIDAVKKALL